MTPVKNQSWFARFARNTSRASGRPWAFGIAIAMLAVWLLSGPVFHFSDTWQLVMNTITSIITFLMVFLIQNAQNRDSEAIQLKLDEVIRALEGAHNTLINIEESEEQELERVRAGYSRLAEDAKAQEGGNIAGASTEVIDGMARLKG